VLVAAVRRYRQYQDMLSTNKETEPVTKIEKWDQRMLALAALVAGWSKDPSTQTGAVIIRPNRTIASVGYNGFPRGMKDDEALYQSREEKYSRVVHAEVNAILNAQEPLHGYILYTWPFQPCDRCATQVIQAGIKHIVTIEPNDELISRWGSSLARAQAFFREAAIGMTIYPRTT
jgi:dCMP deaminase